METHFVRVRPKTGVALNGPLESLVLDHVPAGRLSVMADIQERVSAYFSRHPDEAKTYSNRSPKDVRGSVSALAERGFLKEINGVRLERWLGTF